MHRDTLKTPTIIAGYINAESGPGIGAERISVGQYTHNESNKRGDWLKHWLVIQNYVALNTVFTKRPDKQATCRSSLGKEKQLDYMLVDRRNMRHFRDAEENDMIDMGCDHGLVLAHFRFPDTKTCDSQTDDKKGNGTRKSTRFVNQTGDTEEPVESISVQEQRFQELEKEANKEGGSGSTKRGKEEWRSERALHESASEAAATTREETEVAKKTLETGPKTAAPAYSVHARNNMPTEHEHRSVAGS